MSILINEKPSLEELTHFGVKGMKWGVRKAQQPDNAGYSQAHRNADFDLFGKGGVNRINNRMNDGKTHDQAVRREVGRNVTKAALIGAGVATAMVVLQAGGSGLASTIAARAETNRGRAAALSIMTPIIAKQRRGVYNITSMK